MHTYSSDPILNAQVTRVMALSLTDEPVTPKADPISFLKVMCKLIAPDLSEKDFYVGLMHACNKAQGDFSKLRPYHEIAREITPEDILEGVQYEVAWQARFAAL